MAFYDFVGVIGLGVGAGLGAFVRMGFCCLDVEEVAFHYFLEGFAVCPIEEVSWNLLLFVGLGVN